MRPASLRSSIFLMAALAACAPAGTHTVIPVRAEETVSVSMPDGTADVRITRENFIARAELTGTRENLFRVIPDVFEEIGLPAPAMDRTRWTATIQNQIVNGPLSRQRMSHYLDCGRSMAGENADTRRVRLTVVTALERVDAERTVLLTRIDATAHSVGGASAAPMPCSSRGPLETLIARGVQLRAAGG